MLILFPRDAESKERKAIMAKLHFYYGVMASSKSALLGINAYNFTRTDNKWEAIKPSIDNRDSETKIVSRIGISTMARALPNLDDYKPKRSTQFILVDEVQFFQPSDIEKLVQIADNSNITIFCYGLKLDSNGNLFPAAAKLLAEADELHQMETVCEIPRCTSMASHHIRFDVQNNIIRDGNQVEVGASQYKSVCRKHFYDLYHGNVSLKDILQKKR